MEQQSENHTKETTSAKEAAPTRKGGKHLPDPASLPPNAINRSGHRVRKPLR